MNASRLPLRQNRHPNGNFDDREPYEASHYRDDDDQDRYAGIGPRPSPPDLGSDENH